MSGEQGGRLRAGTPRPLRGGSPDAGWKGARGKLPEVGRFRDSRAAGAAVGPQEQEGGRGRGSVPLAASQRWRQGGLQALMGLALCPVEAWLLLCFRGTELRVGKNHQTMTTSLTAKQLAPTSPPEGNSEHPLLQSLSLLP